MQRDFKYLDDLIHSREKEIVLDSDIVLNESEVSQYLGGISLDVDDLIIDGGGFTVDACGKARIFNSTARNITIKNLIVKNASGAIYNFRGVLNILNSIFLFNKAEISGGAIYNEWGEVKISHSRFYDNVSGCHGGAIFNVNGEINISGSDFKFNSAKNDGGAIFNGAKLNIDDSTFSYNKAEGSGGAIYDNRGETNIKNSTLSNSISMGVFGGGAVHKNRGAMNIISSKFSQNTSEGDGGAIFSIDGEITILKSEFEKNTSKSHGGAIYDWGSLKIEDSGLLDNAADNGGGAIFTKNKPDLINCRFSDNRPDETD